MLSVMKPVSVATVLLLSSFIAAFSQDNAANENDRFQHEFHKDGVEKGLSNRTRIERMLLILTDHIRLNLYHPYNPCSILRIFFHGFALKNLSGSVYPSLPERFDQTSL